MADVARGKTDGGAPALVKQINALAEEAGQIVAAEGLVLGPPEAVLRQAEATSVRPEARRRLHEIFTEIAALKRVLAERKARPK